MNSTSQNKELPFLEHLVELRDRLLKALLAILIIFIVLLSFANELYSALAEPLLRYLPENSSMIAIDPAGSFIAPFKLALVLSIFIAMPIILFQLWGFIAPGLYQHEKRLALPLLLSTTLLFYLGMIFAFYVVFPLIFAFFTATAPDGVNVMTDISRYLDFVLKLFFAFGLAFEVPIATIIFVITGMTSAEKLIQKRPYIIVAAFILGMLLTPPDIISQVLLAIPIWLLFELGVFFSRFITAKQPIYPDQEVPSTSSSTHPPQKDALESLDINTDYQPLSEKEMDDELDRLEDDEKSTKK